MPITILSPYSGKPVKVRDQDVGRAIRDEEGRIFYIVEDEAGGPYAAMTRKGSEKDLARYRKLTAGGAVADQRAKENVLAIHDATGTKRRNPIGILILLILVAAVIAGAYVYFVRPDLIPGLNDNPPTENPTAPEAPLPDGETSGLRQTPRLTSSSGHRSGIAVTSRPQEIETDLPASASALCWGHVFLIDPAQVTNLTATPDTDATALAKACLDFFGMGAAVEPLAQESWSPDHDRLTVEANNAEDPFADYRVMDSGLRYHVSKRGAGPQAVAGSYVEVRYAVYDMAGGVLVADETHRFVLMSGQAIRAMEEGLAGMRPGGQRQLMVPRGHSQSGQLKGLDRLPRLPFQIDLELTHVQRGVSTITEQAGLGEPAMPGDAVELAYEAWVEGAIEPFDSSDLRRQPMRVTLGTGQVITGLEAGLRGICEGETRLLTIPPYLAYGSEGAAGGLIPPDAVINYRITVQAIHRPTDSQ